MPKEDDILLQEEQFVERLREDSENADRGTDRGIINEEKGSSILLKENGDATLASTPLAQIKIDADGETISSVSVQNNTITNRKNLVADELLFNEHKFNTHISDLSDMRVLLGKKEISAGNLNVASTMLVKVWDNKKGKWTLIRRQARMPLFYNKTTLPDAPYNMSVDTDISLADNEDISRVFELDKKESSIEDLRNEYDEKGFDKMPLEVMQEYLKNKKEAEDRFKKTGEWSPELAKKNKDLRERFGISDDKFSAEEMEEILNDIHRDKNENLMKYFNVEIDDLRTLIDNKIKADEIFKEDGEWSEDLSKKNEVIREKYKIEDITVEELHKVLDERSYSSVVLNERYFTLPLNVVQELIDNKIKAEEIYKKTKKWDKSISIKNDSIRQVNGIDRDLSLTELSRIKTEIKKRKE